MKTAFETQARQVAAFAENAHSSQASAEESKQAEAPTRLSSDLIERMNALSDQLIEQRKVLKAPSGYPQRENISQFREALNGTLRITTDGTVDTLDVSTAPSGAILVTTSQNEIKLLDGSRAL